MALTRHGSLGVPLQLRPMMVPTTQSGSATSSHMRSTERTEVSGTTAREPYTRPTQLSTRAVAKQTEGKSAATEAEAAEQAEAQPESSRRPGGAKDEGAGVAETKDEGGGVTEMTAVESVEGAPSSPSP